MERMKKEALHISASFILEGGKAVGEPLYQADKRYEISRGAENDAFSNRRGLRSISAKVAVAGNVCDNEIAGCAQGYNPEIGDEVLIANVDNTDNDYIIICKVV